MKKYLIGFIAGALISLSASVYAEDVVTLVGKAIEGEFPVTYQGNKLEKKALVIDGTSYLPVRAIGETMGLDVTFDADLGIFLKRKEATVLADTVPKTQDQIIDEKVTEKLTVFQRQQRTKEINDRLPGIETNTALHEEKLKDYKIQRDNGGITNVEYENSLLQIIENGKKLANDLRAELQTLQP